MKHTLKFPGDTKLEVTVRWRAELPFRRTWASWEMGQQEPYEVQQGQMSSPAPGKDKPLARTWARPCLAGSSSAAKACECQQTGSGTGAQLHALAATRASSSWAVWTGDQPGDPRNRLSPLLSTRKTTPRYLDRVRRENLCQLKQERFRLAIRNSFSPWGEKWEHLSMTKQKSFLQTVLTL